MNRYREMFGRLHDRGEAALGAFVMLGDPNLEQSAALLDTLVAGGADMIEVGIPFSDPIADGPVIQAAAQRALRAGAGVGDCFALIRSFRQRHSNVPVGILTYANLVLARGIDAFPRAAAEAGADSLLVADLPAHEAAPWVDAIRLAQVAPVLIAASNTPDATLRLIAELSGDGGYTYCVTRRGVTGATGTAEFDAQLIGRVRAAAAPPPVFGFGISRPAHVSAAVGAGAAGVISGSAIVAVAAEGGDVQGFVASLKRATCR